MCSHIQTIYLNRDKYCAQCGKFLHTAQLPVELRALLLCAIAALVLATLWAIVATWE